MAAEPQRASASSATWRAQLSSLARLIGERAPAPGLRVSRPLDGRLRVVAGSHAEPFRMILAAGLQPGVPSLRWAIVVAAPKTSRAGRASERALTRAAAEILASGTIRRQAVTVASGDPGIDALLADLAPGFAALIATLTDRQREVGRLLLVDRLRRSEVAAALGISRPTVSVMVDRARLLELDRFARGLDAILLGAVRPMLTSP